MYHVFIVLAFISSNVNAHLILNIPEVWGSNDGVSLEEPLDQTTSNPICAGKSPEDNGIVQIVAGRTYNFPVTCGEKNINAPGCLSGDWHAGSDVNDYAGCALGVSYNGYNSQSNFKYISYSPDCGKRGVDTSFKISQNIRNCNKCICSWSWAPSRKYSSPGQFYHNCFYCSISGGIANATMRNLDFINVKGTQNIDLTYNDINPVNIYSNDNPQPQEDNPQPQEDNPQPQEDNPQPQEDNPQPQEDNPQPQEDNPQPQEDNPPLQDDNPQPPHNDNVNMEDYELFKEFKEYLKFKKFKEQMNDDCNDTAPTQTQPPTTDEVIDSEQETHLYKRHLGVHHNHNTEMKLLPTPTPFKMSPNKVCRYRTITKTICKPTNSL